MMDCVVIVLDIYASGGLPMLDCEARWREEADEYDSVISFQIAAIPPLSNAKVGDQIIVELSVKSA